MGNETTEEKRASSMYAQSSCSATFELANGEYVSPCHLPAGHEGSHKGTVLGSVCSWPQEFASEYEIWIEDQKQQDLGAYMTPEYH